MNIDIIQRVIVDDLYYIIALIWLCTMSFALGLIMGIIWTLL